MAHSSCTPAMSIHIKCANALNSVRLTWAILGKGNRWESDLQYRSIDRKWTIKRLALFIWNAFAIELNRIGWVQFSVTTVSGDVVCCWWRCSCILTLSAEYFIHQQWQQHTSGKLIWISHTDWLCGLWPNHSGFVDNIVASVSQAQIDWRNFLLA